MKGKFLAIAAVGLMLSACNGNQQADQNAGHFFLQTVHKSPVMRWAHI